MKNILNSKDEKITEKAFSQGLLVSLLSILLCLVVLCSMTYAWFTGGTESNCNTLVSGSFGLAVAVVQTNGDTATASEITVAEVEGKSGVYSCTLPANGKYTVTLSLKGESTAKGHCVVKIHGVEKSTEAIIGASTMNKEGYTPNSPFAFTIETSSETVEVELQAVWGVVVSPDIEPDKTYLADAWKETNSSSEEPST